MKNNIIDDKELNRVKEKIIASESNLIKAMNYDFNIELPLKYLYDIVPKHFKKDYEIFNMTRTLVLDMSRTGCTLFYKPINIAFASILFSNILIHGSFDNILNKSKMIIEEDEKLKNENNSNIKDN